MKKILLAILLLITATTGFGIVDTQKITIQEAVEIASKNNLDLQVSRINLDIAENNIKTANRLQNPSIGAQFEMGKAGKGNPQQIGLIQTIEMGKRGPRKDLAKANRDLTQKEIEYLETDLRMDVREAYTNLLAKKAVLTSILRSVSRYSISF